MMIKLGTKILVHHGATRDSKDHRNLICDPRFQILGARGLVYDVTCTSPGAYITLEDSNRLDTASSHLVDKNWPPRTASAMPRIENEVDFLRHEGTSEIDSSKQHPAVWKRDVIKI